MNAVNEAVNDIDFMIHVRLISCALSIQNQELLHELERLFSTLIGPEYFARVLTLAAQQVAGTDSPADDWFLPHGYRLPPHPLD